MSRRNRMLSATRTWFGPASMGRLLLLAAGMAVTWYLAAPMALQPEERQTWEKVRAAQQHLSQWRRQTGTASPPDADARECGLIGIEWSGITTSLGDLGAKRTACNPAWAVQFHRWFRELGLAPEDPVGIYASGSFPGMLLNAMAAAEASELDILLIVSLGASEWGANHPDAPWPVLAAELRRAGYLRTRADFYTLGGVGELGGDMAPEHADSLRRAAADADVPILNAADLQDMVTVKTELLERHQARVLISIGGSQANLGDAEQILKLGPGLVKAAGEDTAGNGVIGAALRSGIPVIHLLNLKRLALEVGIPFDSPPRRLAPVQVNPWWAAFGLALFFAILWRHRRWELEPGG